MKIRDYFAPDDFTAVEELWQATLGRTSPVSRRVLYARICGRRNYEPGDAVVAEHDGRVAGFAAVEVPRTHFTPSQTASLQAVLVAPGHQRRELGRRLLARVEERARSCDCTDIRLSCGLYRFWSNGVPEDLPGARAFFESHGYAFSDSCFDLIVPLSDYGMSPKYRQCIRDAGVEIVPAAPDDIGPMLEFESRDLGGWVDIMLDFVLWGDIGNILLVKHGDRIVGSAHTFTPQSRFRGANLVWEAIHGTDMGGFGAIGISEPWRGKGLGAALCQAACEHIRHRGGTCAFIDWTGIPGFYAKSGAAVWRTYHSAQKAL